MDFANNLNHVVSYLFIECGTNKINQICLKFIENRENIDLELKFDTNEIEIYDNHYLIKLTKSIEFEDLINYGINFSTNGHIIINFDNENIESKECSIYVLNLQAIKFKKQIMGLYYSK